MTRRDFIGVFLIGALVGWFKKKFFARDNPGTIKEARFWKVQKD